MALMKCPEYGKDCSTQAEHCPNCGYPIAKKKVTKITYVQQVVKIRCWGRGQETLNKKLRPYIQQGWKVVSIVEDPWQGGMLSPVYKVVFSRPK